MLPIYVRPTIYGQMFWPDLITLIGSRVPSQVALIREWKRLVIKENIVSEWVKPISVIGLWCSVMSKHGVTTENNCLSKTDFLSSSTPVTLWWLPGFRIYMRCIQISRFAMAYSNQVQKAGTMAMLKINQSCGESEEREHFEWGRNTPWLEHRAHTIPHSFFSVAAL